MAQKTEKEETEFKVVPEAMNNCVNNNCVIPCVNNCGLTGNLAMNNMCQKCFTSTTSTSISSSPASVVASAAGVIKFGEKSPRSSSSKRSSPERTTDRAEMSRYLMEGIKEASSTLSPVVKREVNRCSCCRRKVGLTGFRCRCDDLFCAEHRYFDRHDCNYDYKAAGWEAIAREDPVVKAAKIVKV